jgi:hypothetical protein
MDVESQQQRGIFRAPAPLLMFVTGEHEGGGAGSSRKGRCSLAR